VYSKRNASLEMLPLLLTLFLVHGRFCVPKKVEVTCSYPLPPFMRSCICWSPKPHLCFTSTSILTCI